MGCPRNAADTRATVDFLFWSERDAIRKELFASSVPLCVWCQETVGDWRSRNPFSADHVESRHCGGAYTPENLALACQPCNKDRGGLSVLGYLMKRAARRAAVCQQDSKHKTQFDVPLTEAIAIA